MGFWAHIFKRVLVVVKGWGGGGKWGVWGGVSDDRPLQNPQSPLQFSHPSVNALERPTQRGDKSFKCRH